MVIIAEFSIDFWNFFIVSCYLWKKEELGAIRKSEQRLWISWLLQAIQRIRFTHIVLYKHVQWRLGERCKMHLREEASKHLSLMPSFIFIVTFYVFIFKSNHPLLLSFQKTIWHGEQHCFRFHFAKCILALNHLIFSRLCYVKYHTFHLCFFFVNCCFLFLLILDVTNSNEINAMTWRINMCFYNNARWVL